MLKFVARPEPCHQVICTECNTSKNYPARKGYQLFSEKPENIFGSNELSSSSSNAVDDEGISSTQQKRKIKKINQTKKNKE